MKLIYILVVTYVNIQNCRICGGESSKVIATSKSHCLKMLLKCVRVEKKDKHEILFFFFNNYNNFDDGGWCPAPPRQIIIASPHKLQGLKFTRKGVNYGYYYYIVKKQKQITVAVPIGACSTALPEISRFPGGHILSIW